MHSESIIQNIVSNVRNNYGEQLSVVYKPAVLPMTATYIEGIKCIDILPLGIFISVSFRFFLYAH